MRPSSLHFFPLALPFVVAAFVLIALAFALIQVGVLEYAYDPWSGKARPCFSRRSIRAERQPGNARRESQNEKAGISYPCGKTHPGRAAKLARRIVAMRDTTDRVQG